MKYKIEFAESVKKQLKILTADQRKTIFNSIDKQSDEESIALSNNQEFMNIIKNARQEFKDGKKISFEKIKQEFS